MRLTAHESWIISTVVDLIDEEAEVIHDQFKAFLVILH
jgi:hypothetical protein